MADSGDDDRARRALHALGLAATVGCTEIAGEVQALFEVPSVLSDRAPDLRTRIEAAGPCLAGRKAYLGLMFPVGPGVAAAKA